MCYAIHTVGIIEPSDGDSAKHCLATLNEFPGGLNRYESIDGFILRISKLTLKNFSWTRLFSLDFNDLAGCAYEFSAL